MELSPRIKEIFHHINLPKKYYFDNMDKIPDPTTGKKFLYKPIVQEYLNSIPTTRGLYLYGREYGHGKSSLAAIILKKFAKRGIYGYWINYKTILDIQYSNEKDKDRMWDCPVLVVDEFDLVESSKKNSARKTIQFETLLRHRYMKELPTIITSNIAPDRKILETYPYVEGILSVLSDCCDSVNVYGKKWRKL